jgi:hypothetical protein
MLTNSGDQHQMNIPKLRLPFLFAGSWQSLQELKCSPLLHGMYYSALIQHTSILHFVDRASRYKFLLITNLTRFFMYLFISCPYMFRASQRSSSGDGIVLIHHLVWLVCVTAWYAGQEGNAVPSWPAYQAVTQTNHTKSCVNTIRSPDDERCDARNM